MDVIKAPTKIERTLYKAEFDYNPPPGTKKAIGGRNDKEVQEKLKGNIIEIGEPARWNLRELYARKGLKLPAEIEILFKESDFWLIQSAFSFMPAHDNQFEWGRIVAIMEPLSEGAKYPIAYDAYPRNIFEEKKEHQKISIGMNLKFAEIIGPNAEYVKEIEFTKLEPVITVGGIGKSDPKWDFRDKASFNLKDVNSLYIIIKAPIGSEGINIRYSAYAQIITRWGGIFPISVEKKLIEEPPYEIRF